MAGERRRESFNGAAADYGRYRAPYPDEVVAGVLHGSGIRTGTPVLEIGCGTGQLSVPLARAGAELVAVELGASLARIARASLCPYPRARVEVSAFEDWPLPDMPFDAVVSASAFHWLDPHVRFAKSARALRPGGSLTIVHAHHVRGGTPGFFEGTQPYYMKWGLSDDPFFKPPAPADAPVMDPELDAQPGFRSVRRRRFEIPRQHTTAAVWDHEGWYTSCARQVQVVRDAGALAVLPIHLTYLAMNIVWTGDFAGAASLVAEIDSVAAVTETRFPPYALLRLRALQGREDEASAAIAAAIEQFGGEGTTVLRAYWAAAVLYNGLARYREAALAAQRATSNALNHWIPAWVLPELVEAAVRGGDAELAREALDRLADTTRPCGTEFALGVEARCRALLSDGAVADELYREAIERLRRTQLRPELARAHLLMASGCAARTTGVAHGSNCAQPMTCWPPSGWRRSPGAHVRSFRQPVRRCASAPWKHVMI